MRLNPSALRAIRERSGLTLSALANATGVNYSHLSNIEAKRRGASPELALALAEALKVPLAALLADPDEVAV